MRTLAISMMLLWCVAVCVAQEEGRKTGCGGSLNTGSSTSDEFSNLPPGTAVVRVELGQAGDIREAKPVSGPEGLRPAALRVVRERKYTTTPTSDQARILHLAVIFAADNATVIGFSQVEHVANPRSARPAIPQDSAAGSPGCPIVGPPTGMQISQEAMQGRLVRKIAPVYPEEAKAKHIEGPITLVLLIDEQGRVIGASKRSGPDILALPAIDAVRQWEYQPYLLNGTPMKMNTSVIVNFAY